jgi:phospholipid transport system substrate-binding protein
MRITIYFFLLIATVEPALIFAQEPLEAVQQNIEKGIEVLEDPLYQDASLKQEQQQKLWEIMEQTYDFAEFSRRVLGSHWNKASAMQRNEFVTTFSEFLGKFYLGKLQDRYSGQKISFLRQQIISDSKALVEIEVSWRNLKIPVTLRVTNRSGKWKVYDLSVLGINAVSNYRAQFKWFLTKKSLQKTIGRLKDRIAKLDERS